MNPSSHLAQVVPFEQVKQDPPLSPAGHDEHLVSSLKKPSMHSGQK